jgi:hypothetical protein
LHANVKSKAVSSPVRSSACTPTGDANASHNPYSRVSPLKRPQDEPPGAVSFFLEEPRATLERGRTAHERERQLPLSLQGLIFLLKPDTVMAGSFRWRVACMTT